MGSWCKTNLKCKDQNVLTMLCKLRLIRETSFIFCHFSWKSLIKIELITLFQATHLLIHPRTYIHTSILQRNNYECTCVCFVFSQLFICTYNIIYMHACTNLKHCNFARFASENIFAFEGIWILIPILVNTNIVSLNNHFWRTIQSHSWSITDDILMKVIY